MQLVAQGKRMRLTMEKERIVGTRIAYKPLHSFQLRENVQIDTRSRLMVKTYDIRPGWSLPLIRSIIS